MFTQVQEVKRSSPPEVTTSDCPQNRKNLRANVRTSLVEGTCYSLMVGLGETYIPAFVIAVGLGEINSGLIATLPILAGSLFQLLSPIMVSQFGSYKRWAVICATIQCLSFIPLILAAMFGYIPASAVFLITAVYQGTSMSISACWNSWIGSLIPCTVRTNFFSTRARLTQIGAMIGFLIGGLILNYREGKSTWQFAVLFLFACLCRAVSVRCLLTQTDVEPPRQPQGKVVPLPTMLRCFKKDQPAGQLLIYLLCMQFAVQISSPFVTPFILKGIHFTYWQFALLTASPYFIKSLIFPFFGKRARSSGGPHGLLVFGGIGVAFVPLLWIVSTNFWVLMVAQGLNGFFWAAYELAGVLLILAKIPEKERISVLTKYNVANAVVLTLGSLVGATILDSLGRHPSSYYILFVVSTAARASTILLLKKLVVDQPRWLLFPLPRLKFGEFDGYIPPIQGWKKILQFKKPAKAKREKTKRAA